MIEIDIVWMEGVYILKENYGVGMLTASSTFFMKEIPFQFIPDIRNPKVPCPIKINYPISG